MDGEGTCSENPCETGERVESSIRNCYEINLSKSMKEVAWTYHERQYNTGVHSLRTAVHSQVKSQLQGPGGEVSEICAREDRG